MVTLLSAASLEQQRTSAQVVMVREITDANQRVQTLKLSLQAETAMMQTSFTRVPARVDFR